MVRIDSLNHHTSTHSLDTINAAPVATTPKITTVQHLFAAIDIDMAHSWHKVQGPITASQEEGLQKTNYHNNNHSMEQSEAFQNQKERGWKWNGDERGVQNSVYRFIFDDVFNYANIIVDIMKEVDY